MRLTDISIRKSPVMLGSWVMEIIIMTPNGEMKSTQYFEDFGGFLTAVKDAAAFFAVRLGKLASQDASARLVTRQLAPNRNDTVN